jgi:hypothetical protein
MHVPIPGNSLGLYMYISMSVKAWQLQVGMVVHSYNLSCPGGRVVISRPA